jgi:hypothetical protein
MLNFFEGNANNEPPINTQEIPTENDEDIGVNMDGMQEACQPLYRGVHSTKLAITLLLMNICIVHGLNNKFVENYCHFCRNIYS